MGNCQAIDNASLVIQHPNGKVERLYSAITAGEVMKLNSGHYVALLLTTTLYSSRPPAATVAGNTQPLRITRIKLLRPTDTLTVGHNYRLITTQEVMKVLMAKKNGKINNNIEKFKPSEEPAGKHGVLTAGKHEETVGRSDKSERTYHQVKKSDKDRRRTAAPANSSGGAMKPRGWHPSLNSISEASS